MSSLAQRKQWKDLSQAQKSSIVASAVIQFALLGLALADISRRKPEEIRGSKAMWRGLAFVNFVGPISYFLFGRR